MFTFIVTEAWENLQTALHDWNSAPTYDDIFQYMYVAINYTKMLFNLCIFNSNDPAYMLEILKFSQLIISGISQWFLLEFVYIQMYNPILLSDRTFICEVYCTAIFHR